jgi:dipeptidyl aminopeptidase/acylaminoacyl peptidase
MKCISVVAWLLAFSMAGAWAQTPATTPPPVADFFRTAQLTNATLSPNGRFMAAIRYVEQTGRHALIVIDLGAERSAKVVAAYQDLDVERGYWVGDSQLVFTLADRRSALLTQQGPGLYVVDREGRSSPRTLIRRSFEAVAEVRASSTEVRTRPKDLSLDPDHRFHSVVRDGSPRVLVLKRSFAGDGEFVGSELLSVNVDTGRSSVAGADAPPRVHRWVVDHQGRARVAESVQGEKRLTHWRATPDAPWTLLREAPRYLSDGGFEVLAVAGDGRLFVETMGQSEGYTDTSVLATLDTQNKQATPQQLVAVKGFDFDGWLIRGADDRVAGVQFLSDAWGQHWFDADMKAIQAAVDKLLPGTVNLLDCGACNKPQRVLVQAFSDRQPDVYFLYDTASGKMETVSGTRPWIKATQMAARSFELIAARDGLELPLHITQPTGLKGAAPTVVLVHGGPWVRGGHWHWHADAQFLASRGYLVLEPEFRGSTGYGSKLYRAGFKQWGLAMQDDLADALQWAVKKGLADPKRVCLVGSSYGGYAALMGLVRHPELFRCAVSHAGVSDINLMFTNDWSDLPGDWKRFGMTALIGDPKADAAQFNASSPLRQAAKITQPLLLAHGRQDRRVPLVHSNAFHNAVKGHNPQAELKVYAEEGHGWSLDKNEIDFWTRVESFLSKSLKP